MPDGVQVVHILSDGSECTSSSDGSSSDSSESNQNFVDERKLCLKERLQSEDPEASSSA